MKKLKITVENCKGYSELYNKKYNTICDAIVLSSIIVIPLAFLSLFIPTLIIITLPIILSCVSIMPLAISLKFKHIEKDISKKYNIDTKISLNKLQVALEEVGIIKGDNEIADVENYIERIKKEKEMKKYNEIKDNYIKENRYANVQASLIISSEEIKKVKTLIRKFD